MDAIPYTPAPQSRGIPAGAQIVRSVELLIVQRAGKVSAVRVRSELSRIMAT